MPPFNIAFHRWIIIKSKAIANPPNKGGHVTNPGTYPKHQSPNMKIFINRWFWVRVMFQGYILVFFFIPLYPVVG